MPMIPPKGKQEAEKDDRTIFERQEDAWYENDCQGSIEEQELTDE